MSYRIVILNGERRGERVEVPATAFSLGRAYACSLTINDAALQPVHAEIIKTDNEILLIRASGPDCRILVNDTAVSESPLRHGDVVEIGTTRFFIQQSRATTWDNMSRLRQKRIWITVILPVVLAGTAITIMSRSCRQSTPGSAPTPRTVPTRLGAYPTNDPSQNDFTVTNIPRIQIDPSITLTSKPPEVVAALTLLDSLRTNTYPNIEDSRQELDGATRFLEQAGDLKPLMQATPPDQSEADLTAAQKALTNEPPAPAMLSTNTPVQAP